MNREIKFRGRDKDGSWHYGRYVTTTFPTGTKHFINKFCDWGMSRNFEIDIKSLGQYTGLKDKNEKEIYEGDIFIWGNMKKFEVYFGTSMWRFREIVPKEVTKFEDWLFSQATDGEKAGIEVIGTIYENPDLLNQ